MRLRPVSIKAVRRVSKADFHVELLCHYSHCAQLYFQFFVNKSVTHIITPKSVKLNMCSTTNAHYLHHLHLFLCGLFAISGVNT